jgi:hypothetical protein
LCCSIFFLTNLGLAVAVLLLSMYSSIYISVKFKYETITFRLVFMKLWQHQNE